LLHTYGTGPGGGSLLAEGLFKDKPDAPPTSGAGTRLMWYPDKAAFRAGEVTGVNWNKDSIGDHSVAMGLDTRAKGIASLAMGNASLATADYAVALGAVANASGTRSVAIGAGTIASNSWSTAIGSYTTASGLYASAIGYMNHAEGNFSMALGENTRAYSKSEMVVGSYNSAYTPVSKTAWAPADRLFVIGNGAEGSGHNAVTVLKNGNIGIGTDMPNAALHIQESETQNGNVVFAGLNDLYTSTPGDPPASEDGSYMMWYADKAAFRAGFFNAYSIRKDSIGRFSVAMSRSSIASGEHAVAIGEFAKASGWASLAMGGIYAAAYGSESISLDGNSWGDYSVSIKGSAEGYGSLAIGGISIGMHSVTLGRNTKAPSFAETVVGQFNSEYTPLSATVWNDADRLFVVGNGVDEKHKSNALTILKNGNTTVGGSLTTEGNVTVTGNLGATGNVLANGDVTANGKLKVNGSKGVVRTISGDQMKTLDVPVVVNTTISGGATANIENPRCAGCGKHNDQWWRYRKHQLHLSRSFQCGTKRVCRQCYHRRGVCRSGYVGGSGYYNRGQTVYFQPEKRIAVAQFYGEDGGLR
ncbi:MAG: hypothetical protein MUE71_10615, partial [Chitinophagaceae bacterium]|nr:hypothetical protein [Chitinophagaceae bacterium]